MLRSELERLATMLSAGSADAELEARIILAKLVSVGEPAVLAAVIVAITDIMADGN